MPSAVYGKTTHGRQGHCTLGLSLRDKHLVYMKQEEYGRIFHINYRVLK